MISKYDRKSNAVYTALYMTKEHPSAETLYGELREQYPNISLNTVYRNIARFRRDGNAVCVAVVNGQERFDANTMPHPHFVCDGCGAVIDLDLATDPPGLNDTAAELSGMTIRSHELIYRGVCPKCVNTESETTEKISGGLS